MAKSIKSNKTAKNLIKKGHPEISCFYRDPITNLILKARADVFGDGYAVDVKTMDDVSPAGFIQAVIKFGYDIQAAHYCNVFDIEEFAFVCVSKKAPFEVAVYILDAEWLEVGHLRCRDAIDRYKDCLDNKKWSGFNDDNNPIRELAVPKWLAAKYLGA